MFCGKCGNQINQGEKFCGKCGNAVQQEQMQYSNATPTLFVQPIVKNSKIKNKKSLVVVLCSIALAVSVVLGVIFIPDWDTDVYVDNGLPSKEQTEFSYIPIYTETSSNVDEESTTDENKSKITKKEKKTTRKNNEGEITTSVTEEPETTTRVAISETTTNKGENSSITDSTTKKLF